MRVKVNCPLVLTIAHYNKHGSPVFVIFLEASKALDRVNHSLLVDKLIKRGVPLCFVRIIDYWYREKQTHVKWGSFYSSFFSVSNGVRQGDILSPFLFAAYMDDLSLALNNQAVNWVIPKLIRFYLLMTYAVFALVYMVYKTYFQFVKNMLPLMT